MIGKWCVAHECYDECWRSSAVPQPAQAEEPSLGELVAEINDNVEVVMICGPSDQMDAEEPRATMTITGPKRLISPLADKFC